MRMPPSDPMADATGCMIIFYLADGWETEADNLASLKRWTRESVKCVAARDCAEAVNPGMIATNPVMHLTVMTALKMADGVSHFHV